MTDQTEEQGSVEPSTKETDVSMDDYAKDFQTRESGDSEGDTPTIEKIEGSDTSDVESNNDKNTDGEPKTDDSPKKADHAEAANDESKEVVKPTRTNRRAERKIKKLSKTVKESEEVIAAKDARIVELEAKLPSNSKDDKPDQDDFDTQEEYLDARDEWKDNRDKADETPSTEGKQDIANETALHIAEEEGVTVDDVEEIRDNFQDVIVDGSDKYPDFIKKTEDLPITLKFAREIAESDVGIDVLYYLSSNQEALDELLDITSERKLAKAVAKLEALVVGNKPAIRTITTSKASEPMPETGSSSGGGDISEMPMEQYGKEFYNRQ